LLSVAIFWQVYKLQKANLTDAGSKTLGQYSILNFALGALSAALWMGYVKLSELSSIKSRFFFINLLLIL